jgi:hypothetical protein
MGKFKIGHRFYEEKGELGSHRSESLCLKWGTPTVLGPKNQKCITWTTTKLKNNKTIKGDEMNDKIKKHLCQNTQQPWPKTMLLSEYEQLEKKKKKKKKKIKK